VTERDPEQPQTISVRMSAEQADELRLLAHFDGRAVADEIRDAVKLLMEKRRKDPDFRKRVEDIVMRGQKLLSDSGHAAVAEALSIQDENLS
jgi:hypothetical protein